MITETHRRRTLNIMSNVYPAGLAELLAEECLELAKGEDHLMQLIGEQLFHGTAGDDPVILQLRAA